VYQLTVSADFIGKLTRVISGHMGWVRAIAVDPGNQWFATGAGDRVVKVCLVNVYHVNMLMVDLGPGIRRVEAIVDWTYLYHPWSCSIRSSPIPFLMCRGQDGQMLGSGNQQGYPTLPWSLLWCLLLIVSWITHVVMLIADSQSPPNPRCPLYGRSRCQCPSLGYAYTSQHFHPHRTH
jgi:hypothetical protein